MMLLESVKRYKIYHTFCVFSAFENAMYGFRSACYLDNQVLLAKEDILLLDVIFHALVAVVTYMSNLS